MFCPRPFTEMYIDEFGNCHLCCPAWMNRHVGNMLEVPLMKLWRGEVATELRESISNQSFSHCTNCGNRALMNQSMRSYDLDVIEVLTLTYDQTCNLACPSCRVTAKGASPLAKEIHAAVLKSGVLKHVKCLRAFGGGDALASSLFRDMLKVLPTLDCHPEMSLSLQTNGLLLTPERYDEVLATGRPIKEVLISIDAATPETYKLVRGGNWDLLMANVAALKGRKTYVCLNFVVQDLNYKEISAFVELGCVLGAHKTYFSVLENWGTYSPEEYLKRAVHLPGHPHHLDLVKVLRESNLFAHPTLTVVLTNLLPLLRGEKT